MNDLQKRLIAFSKMVLFVTKSFQHDYQLRPLSEQLCRSATSIGANYAESQSADSRKDFHHKIRIALTEARETEYWLAVLEEHHPELDQIISLATESTTIVKILTTIARKTEPNPKHR